jgi:hypothetical protein
MNGITTFYTTPKLNPENKYKHDLTFLTVDKPQSVNQYYFQTIDDTISPCDKDWVFNRSDVKTFGYYSDFIFFDKLQYQPPYYYVKTTSLHTQNIINVFVSNDEGVLEINNRIQNKLTNSIKGVWGFKKENNKRFLYLINTFDDFMNNFGCVILIHKGDKAQDFHFDQYNKFKAFVKTVLSDQENTNTNIKMTMKLNINHDSIININGIINIKKLITTINKLKE